MADTLDLKNIRPGDTVMVRCIVKSVNGFVAAETDDMHPSSVKAELEAIVGHTPAAPKVGDRVYHPDRASNGTLIAVEGDWAVVKHAPISRPDVWPLSDLVRV